MRHASTPLALVILVFALLASPAAGAELRVAKGGSADIPLSYASAFTLEFDGEFTPAKLSRWTAKRYVYDGSGNASLDLFEPGNVRLARGDIHFMSAAKGKIRNPGGEKDHYALVRSFAGRHKVALAYDPGRKRCSVSVDGKVEGDFELRIRKAGKIGKLSFPGFAGTIRWTAGGGGGLTTLDTLVGGGATTAGGGNGQPFTAPGPGTLAVTAKLSTTGPATLSAVVKSGGAQRTWLLWKRNGDKDPSPLHVDGKPLAESMFERSPGDWSPRETKVETKLRAGDVVTLKIEGDTGSGTPVLTHAFRGE